MQVQKFIVTVFAFDAVESSDSLVASFGPFTNDEMKTFTRKHMGALATGFYWDFAPVHDNMNELSHIFIKGTRDNP